MDEAAIARSHGGMPGGIVWSSGLIAFAHPHHPDSGHKLMPKACGQTRSEVMRRIWSRLAAEIQRQVKSGRR